MVQEIMMWISVISAFGYTGYSLVKSISNAYQQKTTGCSGGCSSGCSAKTDLLKQLKNNQFKPVKVSSHQSSVIS